MKRYIIKKLFRISQRLCISLMNKMHYRELYDEAAPLINTLKNYVYYFNRIEREQEKVIFEQAAKDMQEYLGGNAHKLDLENQNAVAPVPLNTTGVIPPPIAEDLRALSKMKRVNHEKQK